jgi:hypothetical protein
MFKACMRIASMLKIILIGIVLTSFIKLSNINADYYFSLYSGIFVSILLLYIIAAISSIYNEKTNTMKDDDPYLSLFNAAKKAEAKHDKAYIFVITLWTFILQLILLIIYYLFNMHHYAYFFIRLASILYIAYICASTISHHIMKEGESNNG